MIFYSLLNCGRSLPTRRCIRKTLGRAATLEMIAGMARVDVEQLLADIRSEMERHPAAGGSARGAAGSAAGEGNAQRKETLKGIIRELHEGGDVASLQARFAELAAGVSAV